MIANSIIVNWLLEENNHGVRVRAPFSSIVSFNYVQAGQGFLNK